MGNLFGKPKKPDETSENVRQRKRSGLDLKQAKTKKKKCQPKDEPETDEDGLRFKYVKNWSVQNKNGDFVPAQNLELKGEILLLKGEMSFSETEWKTLKTTESGVLIEWFGWNLGRDSAALGVKDSEFCYILLNPVPEYEPFGDRMIKLVHFASCAAELLKCNKYNDMYFHRVFSIYQQKPNCLIEDKEACYPFLYENAPHLLSLLRSYAGGTTWFKKSKFIKQLQLASSGGILTPVVAEVLNKRKDKKFHAAVKKWVGTPILLRDATFDKRETTQKNEIISFFFNEELQTLVCVVKYGENDHQEFKKGDFVILKADQQHILGQIHYINKENGTIHFQQFFTGPETILRTFGKKKQLFEIQNCADVPIRAIVGKVEEQIIFGSVNNEKYYCTHQYFPHDASFKTFKDDPNAKCRCCDKKKRHEEFLQPTRIENTDGFKLQGKSFVKGSFILVQRDCSSDQPAREEVQVHSPAYIRARPEYWRWKKRNRRFAAPKPQMVGQIKEVKFDENDKPTQLKIAVLKRAEDFLSVDRSRHYHPHELFATDEEIWVDINCVADKCFVTYINNIAESNVNYWIIKGPNRFFVEKKGIPIKNLKTKFREKQLTDDQKQWQGDVDVTSGEPIQPPVWPSPPEKLKTFDAYSGPGGMACGLQESGLAKICHGLDMEQNCTNAFDLNFPGAITYNMSVDDFIKRYIWNEGIEHKDLKFPKKGEVDLLCGGPPCQGYSGFNRFPKSKCAKRNRFGSISFISLVELLQPRYVLFENVAHFATFKQGAYLKTMVQSLLDLGYQCRMGNLGSAAHGVPQTRNRFIIMAAKHGEILPQMPRATHCASGRRFQLNVNGLEVANETVKLGAPFREITTDDAISDLPPDPTNDGKCDYAKVPGNPFQAEMRGDCTKAQDHETKELSNLDRLRIPFIPEDCDWTHIPNDMKYPIEKGKRTSCLDYKLDAITCPHSGNCRCNKLKLQKLRSKYKNSLIPFHLAHTANNNSDWNGAYGRGSRFRPFQIVTTSLSLGRKQGKIIHPTLNRCFSILEIRRAQGIPDWFHLYGNYSNRISQVGNAVPPPLAKSIGRAIVEALCWQENNY